MTHRLHQRILRAAHDLLFKSVHSRMLICNTCWEDPRIDRQLMRLDKGSRVVTLTSAGCNSLDYLLDKPAAIHAVDVNLRQNALLELKLALIEGGEFEDLFDMFGRGAHERFAHIYQRVRPRLSEPAAAFWDDKISYFDARSRRRSFYYRGGAGTVAWGATRYLLRKPALKEALRALFDAQSLDEQRWIYANIEPAIWGKFITWAIRHPLTLALLGVPRSQIRLVNEQYPGGMANYVRDKLRNVFTNVHVRDNYFWRVYLTGSYTPECCPNYLKAENYAALRERAPALKIHTNSLSRVLRHQPGPYTHFVLLDHQDWLARHDPRALEDEWRLIIRNSRPGSRVLMRSALQHLDFLPSFVRRAVRFLPELTQPLHLEDRVGTYGSVHLADVL